MIGVEKLELENVKKILSPYLEEHQLSLYDISFYKEDGNLILQVLLDKNGGISIDELAECNDYLSSHLDDMDQDMPEYFLEVSSPGAEKELRNIDEIKQQLHSYVHVELENMIYEGTLEQVEDNQLTIRFNAKGRFKKVEIPYEKIHFIRLAVKF